MRKENNKYDFLCQGEYWKKEFEGEIPVLDMPYDNVRPQEQSHNGDTIEQEIDKLLSDKIRETVKKYGVTEYMLFLTGLMITLGKYSRQEDVVIGSPVSGRVNSDTEKMLGMFVNTLAMRGRPERGKTYEKFIREIKETCLKAYENQEYPFEELVEEIEVERDMSRNPLFDVMLTYQNTESIARLIDAFVDSLDLAKYNVKEAASKGRPSYDQKECTNCTFMGTGKESILHGNRLKVVK